MINALSMPPQLRTPRCGYPQSMFFSLVIPFYNEEESILPEEAVAGCQVRR